MTDDRKKTVFLWSSILGSIVIISIFVWSIILNFKDNPIKEINTNTNIDFNQIGETFKESSSQIQSEIENIKDANEFNEIIDVINQDAISDTESDESELKTEPNPNTNENQ